MAGHYDPAQPRDKDGEWTNGAGAVASHFTGHHGGSGKAKAPEHDFSTREGRAAAAASADIMTPAGRALVRKVQRANEDAVMGGRSNEERTRQALVMYGTAGARKALAKAAPKKKAAKAARKKAGS